jgi:hypothetical protein
MMLEKTIKAAVRKRLKELGVYQFWPVQYGLGTTTLDILVCYKGRFVAIETKRPGGMLTARQIVTIQEMRANGAIVFVIDSLEDVGKLTHDFIESHAARIAAA